MGDPRTTFVALVSSYNECQTTPFRDPGGEGTDSSSAIWKETGMLTFYAGDPNSRDTCAFSNSHSDSAILVIGGAGCGMLGAGQVGTNNVNFSTGKDWHA